MKVTSLGGPPNIYKRSLDIETTEDTPLIQFGRVERSRPKTIHDALVITAILANYEVECIFIDSGSSTDIHLRRGIRSNAVRRRFLGKKTKKGDGFRQDLLKAKTKKKQKPLLSPAKELLNIKIILGNPNKTTRIGSHLGEEAKKEITLCLQRNADIFARTPQDLEGIDPQVITHHLNIDPNCKPVKQKKRRFGPEKDKIIQAEVNKLMAAGHIKEIQFPE
ncbi:UNVERIFIED_CONTAM: hypothetical protein Slati_3500100 [Sesamum latifolium]|uniref:Uncharacterized protein n=1 Tax=Sesamum latifolium TaxID=2727402 RepID=A0AAW2UI60_9LAMI